MRTTHDFRPECVLLDLDDTLYDVPGMRAMVAQKIKEYMLHRLNVPKEVVDHECSK